MLSICNIQVLCKIYIFLFFIYVTIGLRQDAECRVVLFASVRVTGVNTQEGTSKDISKLKQTDNGSKTGLEQTPGQQLRKHKPTTDQTNTG